MDTSPSNPEDDAILQLQRDFVKNANAYRGIVPWPGLRRTREQLEAEFSNTLTSTSNDTDAATTSITTKSDTALAHSTLFGEAYPPCCKRTFLLEPMKLNELLLETRHSDRVVFVRTFGSPKRTAATPTVVQAAIEDRWGNVERLAMYNLPPSPGADDGLAKGTILAVRSPYLTRASDGGTILRVDHLSDFHIVEQWDARFQHHLNELWTRVTFIGLPAPGREWVSRTRKEGDQALLGENYHRAYTLYSLAEYYVALDTYDNSGVPQAKYFAKYSKAYATIKRNMASVCYHLRKYEEAITNALLSMHHFGLDLPNEPWMAEAHSRALSWAGRAAYALCEYAKAEQYFDRALRLKHNQETAAYLEKTRQRLQEEQNGYTSEDFADMARTVDAAYKNEKSTKLDRASFLANTRIGPWDKKRKRNGMFATRPIKAGQVVFVEKALHMAHYDATKLDGNYNGNDNHVPTTVNINSNRVSKGAIARLLAGLVYKLTWNRRQALVFFELFDGTDLPGGVLEVEGKQVVNVFRVQAIVELNAFSCPGIRSRLSEKMAGKSDSENTSTKSSSSDRSSSSSSSAGIWLHAARANHSSLPNVDHAFIGDMMVVRAVRDIADGEKILMSYLSRGQPHQH